MATAPRPLVWLQPTEPDRVAPLRALAAELAALPQAPEVQIGRPDACPDPQSLPPAALIVLAGDLLPVGLIEAASARGIALVWAEAGAAPRLDRRTLLPGRLRRCLQRLDAIHAESTDAAQALGRLLREMPTVQPSGRLARHPPAAPCNPRELDALRRTLAARPAWFAYSLPVSEFAATLSAQVQAMRQSLRLVLLAAPRDPRDGPDLLAQADALGLPAALLTTDDAIGPDLQVLIADAEDAPGLFMRLAPVTYLGGSLTPGAGTPPPAEPAALGSALIAGPERERGLIDRLIAAGGGRGIRRSDELGPTLAALLVPGVGALAALQAWTLVSEGSEATQALLREILDRLAPGRLRPVAPAASGR